MGAHKRALVALDAVLGLPHGHGHGNAALLVSRSALGELAVHIVHKGGNRQAVAVLAGHRLQNVLHHLHGGGVALQRLAVAGVHSVCPVGGNLHLVVGVKAGVNGLPVHLHNGLALFGEALLGGLLHILDGVLAGQHARQRKERGLQNGVGALAQADLHRLVDGVDGVELDVVLRNVPLGFSGHVLVQLFVRPLAVDHEHAAGLHVLHHLVALDHVAGVVAGHKVSLVDVVGRADGLVAEAQVADGHAAGLFRVVLEVRLDVLVGVVADDLGAVLVGAHGAVAAKAPEFALLGALGRGVGSGLLLQRKAGHVVHNANGKAALGLGLRQLVVHGEHAAGRGVFGAQAVAAADHGGVVARFAQGGQEAVEVLPERSHRTRLAVGNVGQSAFFATGQIEQSLRALYGCAGQERELSADDPLASAVRMKVS